MTPIEEADERKYRCGWCGHPCNAEGDKVELNDLIDNPDAYQGCGHVNGKCCSGNWTSWTEYGTTALEDV